MILTGRSHRARAAVREAMKLAGIAVIAEVSDAERAVDAGSHTPATICVVTGGAPREAARATRSIVARLPAATIVVVADAGDQHDVAAALAAGACAYVLGDASPAQLVAAIAAARDGYVTAPVQPLWRALSNRGRYRRSRRLALSDGGSVLLTEREAEVLDAMLGGASSSEIASELHISAVTVRRHVSHLLRKADVASRAELIALAARGADPATGRSARAIEPNRLPPAPEGAALTPREREILRLVAAGARNEDIARELVVAVSTVRNHVTRIIKKLGARNRAAAAVLAVRRQMI